MAGICEGRVVIVTGAARGLGRAHALELARQGAQVVVNDIGAELDGTGGSSGPAAEVVAEIEAAGGAAIVNGDDVGDFAGAGHLVGQAIEVFGRLDAVVNNAGIVRDRMFANVAEDEWDAVIRVNLKGHFTVSRHAAAHWRDRAKAGETVDRAHRQHLIGSRHPRVGRTGRLLGRKGRHRRAHPRAGRRAGPLRGHRERPCAGGTHPHDRGRVHRDDGRGGRRRVRRHGPCQRVTARRLAGRGRQRGRDRSDVRDRRRQHRCRGRLAARTRRTTRAPGGTPRRSATPCARSSPPLLSRRRSTAPAEPQRRRLRRHVTGCFRSATCHTGEP